LWSHKLLRYLCFIFLIGAYLTNIALLNQNDLYKITFLIQNAFYLIAILSPIFEKKGLRIVIFYIINYFLILNIASGHAFIKYILGKKQVVWTPRKG
jgi:hypothetical protein